MRASSSLFTILVLLLSSCASVDPTDYVTKWEDIPTGFTLSCQSSGQSEVLEVARFRAPETGIDRVDNALEALFSNSASPVESVSPNVRSVQYEITKSSAKSSLTSSDFKRLEEELQAGLNFNNQDVFSSTTESAIAQAPLFKEYFKAFLNDGYVTRKGDKLKQLELSMTYGSERFGAATRIFAEALADSMSPAPVLTRGSGSSALYLPGENKNKPTSVAVGRVEAIALTNDPKHCGITELEYKVMRTISAAASEQSARAASLIIEQFGGLELSYFVGGKLSLGDTETLPTVVRAFVGTVVEAAQYAAMYEFFYNLSYETVGGGGQNESLGGISIRFVGVSTPGPQLESAGGGNPFPKLAAMMSEFAEE